MSKVGLQMTLLDWLSKLFPFFFSGKKIPISYNFNDYDMRVIHLIITLNNISLSRFNQID